MQSSQGETLTQVFLTHLVGVFSDRCCIENSWGRKKKQLSDVLSEFAIFLKLRFLWWKLKIFIANFSHVSPNRFWRIFSMLLNSHPMIKMALKKILLQFVWCWTTIWLDYTNCWHLCHSNLFRSSYSFTITHHSL